jgi:hypothetical protein
MLAGLLRAASDGWRTLVMYWELSLMVFALLPVVLTIALAWADR